ncbi:unnamed protein product [Euphydryas editha]|uniref:HTH CENPB-type domain-containing protein n=1 Tax=Euphydryas editha TaxID=104508 RepID=A0AAU9V9R7_EUPED|nr:unnamed protein product [Euphydryas editha]
MKKRQYSKQSIDNAIRFVQNKQGSIRLAAKTFGVPRSSIIFKLANPKTKFKSGPDTILTTEEEEHLVNYIISLSHRGFPRKKDDILDSVQFFLKENPRPNPFKNGRPGEKWFSSFMKRHPNLTERTAEGVTKASACVSEYDIRKWFSEIENFFEKEHLCEGKSYQKRGRKTSTLLRKLLRKKTDLVAAKTTFPVILYVDGHKTHLTKEVSELCKSLEIHLIALYPNATRILQPADVASFKPIKSGWKKHLRLWYAENENGAVLNKQNFAPLLQRVVESSTNPSIAKNGFRTTGLFPFNPDAINYDKCLGNKEAKNLSAIAITPPFNTMIQSSLNFNDFKTIVGAERITVFESSQEKDIHFENEESRVIFNLWKQFLKPKECDSRDPDILDLPILDREEPSVNTKETYDYYLDEATGELRKERNNIEPLPSTSSCDPNKKITVLSTGSFSDYLKRKMWPASPKRKGIRKTERIPYALTSDTYLKIMKEKEDKKKELQLEKENKKKIREEKKALSEHKKNKGKGKRTRLQQTEPETKSDKNIRSDTCLDEEMTDSVLSQVNINKYRLCSGCSRTIYGVNVLECVMCDRQFHDNCVPNHHKIHIPFDEDDYVCHICYQLNKSGSSTDELFEMFQEEAKKCGF